MQTLSKVTKEEQIDFSDLPEGAESWRVDKVALWLATRLEEVALMLKASQERERLLMGGLIAIVNEESWCAACGNPRGQTCVNVTQCRFEPVDPRAVAEETLIAHRNLLQERVTH
jgi:hypothetical protein